MKPCPAKRHETLALNSETPKRLEMFEPSSAHFTRACRSLLPSSRNASASSGGFRSGFDSLAPRSLGHVQPQGLVQKFRRPRDVQGFGVLAALCLLAPHQAARDRCLQPMTITTLPEQVQLLQELSLRSALCHQALRFPGFRVEHLGPRQSQAVSSVQPAAGGLPPYGRHCFLLDSQRSELACTKSLKHSSHGPGCPSRSLAWNVGAVCLRSARASRTSGGVLGVAGW